MSSRPHFPYNCLKCSIKIEWEMNLHKLSILAPEVKYHRQSRWLD